MSKSVLICDNYNKEVHALKKHLEESNLEVDLVNNGKDAQLAIADKKYSSIVLDFDIKAHSSLEVLTFARVKSYGVNIFLAVNSEAELKEYGIEKADYEKLGINAVIEKPYNEKKILELVEDYSAEKKWKNLTDTSSGSGEEREIRAADDDFTKLPIEEFYTGKVAIFDLYIRIGNGRYIKFVHRGGEFSKERMDYYRNEKKVEVLYFKTKERATYINFVNDYLKKYLSKRRSVSVSVLKCSKGLIDNFVDDIYLKGLSKRLVDEGKDICDNIYTMVKQDSSLSKYLDELLESDPESASHSFLTTIFSSIIMSNMEWAGKISCDYVSQGALLHRIGYLKLPEELREKNITSMSIEELVVYETYPSHGYDLLYNSKLPQQVKQIVYQHREYINGEGFPNHLFGTRIFPLAKIVSFASDFATLIQDLRITPIAGIKKLISDRENVVKYDSGCIKAFIMGLK